jgi:hypothetical protein
VRRPGGGGLERRRPGGGCQEAAALGGGGLERRRPGGGCQEVAALGGGGLRGGGGLERGGGCLGGDGPERRPKVAAACCGGGLRGGYQGAAARARVSVAEAKKKSGSDYHVRGDGLLYNWMPLLIDEGLYL